MAMLLLVATPTFMIRGLPLPTGRENSRFLPTAISMQSGSIKDREPFKLALDLGKNGKGTLLFKPSVSNSEAVVVRYKVPFGLNVENRAGQAICSKDGPGGEREGDILRKCSPVDRPQLQDI